MGGQEGQLYESTPLPPRTQSLQPTLIAYFLITAKPRISIRFWCSLKHTFRDHFSSSSSMASFILGRVVLHPVFSIRPSLARTELSKITCVKYCGFSITILITDIEFLVHNILNIHKALSVLCKPCAYCQKVHTALNPRATERTACVC